MGYYTYSLGSVQFKNNNPSKVVSVSLKWSLDMEMLISGLETKIDEVKADLNALKTDFKE